MRFTVTQMLELFRLKGVPPKILLLKLGNIANTKLFEVIESVYHTVEQLFENGNIE